MLKAASIIVKYDEKSFRYNPGNLRDGDSSEHSDEENIRERLQLTVGKAANNLSHVSSGSQTFKEQHLPTDNTDNNGQVSSSPPALDYKEETKKLVLTQIEE